MPHNPDANGMGNLDSLLMLAHRLAREFDVAELATDKPLLLDRLQQHVRIITTVYQHFSSDVQEKKYHSLTRESG